MLGRVPKAFPIHHLSFFNVSDFIPRYVMLLQCFSAAVTPTFMQGWSDTFVGIVLRPLAGSQMAIYTCAKVLRWVGIHSTWHGVLIILFPARRGGEVFLETSPEARHAHGVWDALPWSDPPTSLVRGPFTARCYYHLVWVAFLWKAGWQKSTEFGEHLD